MAPLIAETGMPAVAAEAALRTSTPESTIGAVTPERMPLAAVREALIAAPIPEAVLTIMTLATNVARDLVEIPVDVSPLASAQVSISPEGPLFAANRARLAPEAACLAARQVALPHAALDAVLLHVLTCIDAALALSRRDGHCDRARE
jgi:hypothetical protein